MTLKSILSRIVRAAKGSDEKIPAFSDWSLNPRIHPLEVSRGYGGRLIDARGREYIDFLSGWGSNILGHGYPRVAKAIKAQAVRFNSLGLPNALSKELSDLLCRIIPCAEMVKFGKNGSDVTLGAVRLARALTDRNQVFYRGYHGFHDWYMAGQGARGIPAALQPLVTLTPDLAISNLETAFTKWAGQVACIIIDPGMPPMLARDHLQAIIDLAHSQGALVIFDEIGTGFRLAPGGVQELIGVTPDLACFGKAIANGMPLSALVGKRVYMSRLHEINFGMTFELESISIAAALATISEILEKKVCEALWEKGKTLKDEYNRLARRYGVATRLWGPDPRAQLQFDDQAGIPERELRWLCVQELVKNRIMTLGTFLLSFTHSEKDLSKTVKAMEKALRIVQKALDKGSVKDLLDLPTYNSIRSS